MVELSYPGVYIQEVPSGVRAISAVSTSNGAFVGFFREGPVNEAVEINGMGDFDRIFGGLDSRSEASYAISQFFLNGGSRAYVVRVVNEDAGAGALAARAAVTINSQAGAGAVMTVQAANEGVWGNTLRLEIDHSTTTPQSFNLRVIRYSEPTDDALPGAREDYLNLSVNPTSGRYFTRVINESSSLIEATHDAFSAGTDPTTYVRPAATGTWGQPVAAVSNFAQLDTGGAGPFDTRLEIRHRTGAATFEVIGTEHTARLDFSTSAPTTMKQLRAALQDAIRNSSPTGTSDPPEEPFAGATVELVEGTGTTPFQFVIRSDQRADGFGPLHYVHVINAGAHLAALGLAAAAQPRFNVQQYWLGTTDAFDHRAQEADAGTPVNAGADGLMPDPTVTSEGSTEAPGLASALIGNLGNKEGLFALEDADLFNILCIPLAAKLPQLQMTAVVSQALAYCETKRAFMIVDIPADINEIQEVKDWVDDNASFRTRNAATYFPRLLMPDARNDFLPRSVGASGTMAGIYARTDTTRGVWKAPAGLDAKLRGIARLDFTMTDPENGSLNPVAINAIRVFPIFGQVAWGGRTLDGADIAASEWKYIPIRRLALMIEESLYRGTHWVVFEPNDEPTWAKVRQNVGAFMMNLFRQGAFQGSSPADAFYVKCDGETTTANDRNLGIVNIEVGFAPLKPAEFVVIKIQQIPDIG